jgi:hypothetical protein
MALATYVDLQASVAAWLNRTDLTAVIPDFVTITESKISRELRLRKQITTSTLTTSIGVRGINLPTDWLEFENVSLLTSPERQLTYAPVEHMDVVYPNNGRNDTPSLYTIEGDQVLFGPTPDSTYTVSILYYAKFPALATASTNWLLVNHPTAYLYGCLMQGCVYLKDKEGAQEFNALYVNVITDLQKQDDQAQHSGSSLRVRRV